MNTYSTADVLTASGLSNNTFQTHMRRKMVVGYGEDDITGGGGPGQPRRFSWQALTQVAVASALIEMGMPASEAYDAAMYFAHTGEGRDGWQYGEGGEARNNFTERYPGLPHHFRDGDTFLIVRSGESKVICAPQGSLPLLEVSSDDDPIIGFFALNASALFHRTCRRLGLNGHALLEQAYPNKAKG